MATIRRGQGPLNIDISSSSSPPGAPPLSALFLIYFDIKAGYTIGWRRSLPSIELEGVVEYKSLPSGLHTVKEDLIYFVHDNHAGLSAFVNAPAAEESRNARMIAVGVMVPLSYGRLGRAWKHAESLKEMASQLVADTTETKVLEEYWEDHKAQGPPTPADADSIPDSPSSIRFKPIRTTSGKPKGHGRNRSASDGTALLPPGHNLSSHHPAWSLPTLLDTFGPLIFPIHRAALLRKRILITGHPPVEETCNFVYDLSILSNIPFAVSDLLSTSAPPQRLRPLFSIGVHDIPLLEEDLKASKAAAASSTHSSSSSVDPRDEPGCGWIACTTDSILAMKSTLYDVLITLPPSFAEDAAEKVWPKVESPQGVEMKATQRDLRRYRYLRWELSRYASPLHSPVLGQTSAEEPPLSSSSNLSKTTYASEEDLVLSLPDTDPITEPLSWSALAYSGFMWWASAGEQRHPSEEEEAESDSILLAGLAFSPSTQSTPNRRLDSFVSLTNTTSGSVSNKAKSAGGPVEAVQDASARQEMAIIAYFHRLTSQILTTISDIVDATDSDDEREASELLPSSPTHNTGLDGEQDEDDSGPEVWINSADMVRMGLDVWSLADKVYVEEVTRAYFGRRAVVEGGRRVDICGVRIC